MFHSIQAPLACDATSAVQLLATHEHNKALTTHEAQPGSVIECCKSELRCFHSHRNTVRVF